MQNHRCRCARCHQTPSSMSLPQYRTHRPQVTGRSEPRTQVLSYQHHDAILSGHGGRSASHSATPPCCKQVPRRWPLKLSVPSRHWAEAPVCASWPGEGGATGGPAGAAASSTAERHPDDGTGLGPIAGQPRKDPSTPVRGAVLCRIEYHGATLWNQTRTLWSAMFRTGYAPYSCLAR